MDSRQGEETMVREEGSRNIEDGQIKTNKFDGGFLLSENGKMFSVGENGVWDGKALLSLQNVQNMKSRRCLVD